MTGLLDTNVALYLLGGRLAEPFPIGSLSLTPEQIDLIGRQLDERCRDVED
jgi:hypothetical protein